MKRTYADNPEPLAATPDSDASLKSPSSYGQATVDELIDDLARAMDGSSTYRSNGYLDDTVAGDVEWPTDVLVEPGLLFKHEKDDIEIQVAEFD